MIHVSALSDYACKMALYKYASFPFSFPIYMMNDSLCMTIDNLYLFCVFGSKETHNI